MNTFDEIDKGFQLFNKYIPGLLQLIISAIGAVKQARGVSTGEAVHLVSMHLDPTAPAVRELTKDGHIT